MNAVERELQAIREREAEHVKPPVGAKERGWERLMAALPGDQGGPDDDGGPGDGGGSGGAAPPPVRPTPLLKMVPLLKAVPLAALLVVGALVPLGMRAEPAIVADRLEPAPEPAIVHGSPVHIPFAPEPPAPAAPEEPPGLPEPPAASTVRPGVPAPARPSGARPRPAGQEDNFAGELSLLAAGQAAIQRGELREGLALLRSHKQRFPGGHFAHERDALIAIARCDSEQAGAREAGRKFLQGHPDSIHADRVRAACEP